MSARSPRKTSTFQWYVRRWKQRVSDASYALNTDIHWAKALPSNGVLEEKVIKSDKVQAEILRILNGEAETDYNEFSKKSLEHSARSIFRKMAADFGVKNMRSLLFVVRRLVRNLFDGLIVNKDGIEAVRSAQSEGPTLLLPNHRSHFDYVLLSYLCAVHHLHMPHIIAGDNLMIKVVGSMLHHCGAVFIRRKFGDDRLYKAVFYEYIKELLMSGATIECFLEGGRSRSGKSIPARGGFLNVILSIFNENFSSKEQKFSDIKLFPISISYDKVVEGGEYVKEMLGANKEKESLSQLLTAAQELLKFKFRMGIVDIFIQTTPISLRETVSQLRRHFIARKPNVTAEVIHSRSVLALGHRVLYECNRETSVSATSLVSTVLLACGKRGMEIHELHRSVVWLKNELSLRGARISPIFQDLTVSEIVERALLVFGSHVVKRRNHIIYGYQHLSTLELSIYRNALMHWFVSDSLVTCSIVACLVSGVKDKSTFVWGTPVQKTELLKRVKFLSLLLKMEFIYKPAPDIIENFSTTIADLETRGILSTFSDDSGENYVQVVRVRDSEEAPSLFQFLCMILWPVINVYWITSVTLLELLPDRIITDKELSKRISSNAEMLFYKGEQDFYECVNQGSIANVLQWFLLRGVIGYREVTSSDGKAVLVNSGQKLVQIRSEFKRESGDSIRELCTLIAQYRKPNLYLFQNTSML